MSHQAGNHNKMPQEIIQMPTFVLCSFNRFHSFIRTTRWNLAALENMWKRIRHYTDTASFLLQLICCTQQIFQPSIHQMFGTYPYPRYIYRNNGFVLGPAFQSPSNSALQSLVADAWCRQVICSRMQVRLGQFELPSNQDIHHDLYSTDHWSISKSRL